MITDRDEEFKNTITFYYDQELHRPPEVPGAFDAWLPPLREGKTGEWLQQQLHDSPEAVALRSKPPELTRLATPNLVPNGMFFPQPLVGTNQFCALRTQLDGGDLTPLIKESRELGFNVWRVFGMGSKVQNGFLDLRPAQEPQYFHALLALALLLNDNGIVLLYTCYADNQDVKAGNDLWVSATTALFGTQSLCSGGNEYDKNGFDPMTLVPATNGLLWSRGSATEDKLPVTPTGTFMEFHPRRLWPTVMLDTVASPVFIYKQRPLIPLIIDEPPRMGTDGSGAEYADSRNCWRFARHYSTECAGAVFHSRAGQVGALMDDRTRACAEAFVRGMQV